MTNKSGVLQRREFELVGGLTTEVVLKCDLETGDMKVLTRTTSIHGQSAVSIRGTFGVHELHEANLRFSKTCHQIESSMLGEHRMKSPITGASHRNPINIKAPTNVSMSGVVDDMGRFSDVIGASFKGGIPHEIMASTIGMREMYPTQDMIRKINEMENDRNEFRKRLS